MKSKDQIFQKIDNKIIEKLEKGKIPWRAPFDINAEPINAQTGSHYSGTNAWLLRLVCNGDPYFTGFRQAQSLGRHVKKGESGFPIMFPVVKYFEKSTGEIITRKQAGGLQDDEVEKNVYYSFSSVWHIDQFKGIDRDKLPSISAFGEMNFEPISRCEAILNHWTDCPEVRKKGHRAFYRKTEDFISIPRPKYFASDAKVYEVIFHEAIHATGHASRLNREKGEQFGDQAYCFEELVAEIGSAYLCGCAGIDKPLIENQRLISKTGLRH